MDDRRHPGLLRALACVCFGHPTKDVRHEGEVWETCVIQHGYCPRCGEDLNGRFEILD